MNCADLERSRAFYTAGLGLEIGAHTAPETAQPGAAFGLDRARWDASILLGPNGYDGGAIDLLQWHEPAPVGAPPAGLVETGFQRLGLRVPDLDVALAAVAAHGGQVWSAPLTHTRPDGAEIRIAMANDPDGTAIELVEGGATALSFVAITCADPARSFDFYVGLGFREVARFPSESSDGSHLHIDGAVAMDEVVLVAPGGGDVLFILVGFRTPPSETHHRARCERARDVAVCVPRRRSRRCRRRARAPRHRDDLCAGRDGDGSRSSDPAVRVLPRT